MKIQNFAAENFKRKVKVPDLQKAITIAKGLVDAFTSLTVAVTEETCIDLRNVFSLRISSYPLSFADKAALLNKLESMQTVPFTDSDLPKVYAQIFDGRLLLQSTVSQTNIGVPYGYNAFYSL